MNIPTFTRRQIDSTEIDFEVIGYTMNGTKRFATITVDLIRRSINVGGFSNISAESVAVFMQALQAAQLELL